jgi:prolyl-tRNA synthetase
VKQAADDLYATLTQLGYDVLLDDRNERPGVKFADIDLIGIPHRFVVGERGLADSRLEYKHRRGTETEDVALDAVEDFVQQRIARR